MAKTKIVGTIGPASNDISVLRGMFRSGLSNIRINTAHIKDGDITQVRKMVDSLNSELGTCVGIMVDLKGPELRTGEFKEKPFGITEEKTYRISGKCERKDDIEINYPAIFSSVSVGDIILMSDGKVKFEVTEKNDDSIIVKALDSGVLKDRSRVNIPGRYLDIGVLTERDERYIDESIKNNVEFFALSFVQRKENVEYLQKKIFERGGNALVISKIETKSGLANLHDISTVSDMIMVARGDLGVELPLKEVSIAQKDIIVEAHKHGVATIVATQMLESMVNSPIPTRAEVSDITNTILDNGDALMLTEETAIGKYPVESIRYLQSVSEYVESVREQFPEPEEFLGNRVAYSIARASKIISEEIDADGILAFTKTGNTARMISAVRPKADIYAAVLSDNLACKLNLLRGVFPIKMPEEYKTSINLIDALSYVEKQGTFNKGDRVVVTSGAPYFLFGGTNDVRVATVGKFIGRGYPIGASIYEKVTRKLDGKGNILLVEKSLPELEKLPENFKGIIFLFDIPHELKGYLRRKGLTVLYNTNLSGELEEGQDVFVDGGTGVITA